MKGASERADSGGSGIEFIGKRIRNARRDRGMSIAELAAATGLSIGFISQVERNQSNPSVKALHDISRALGVNITWFFDDTAAAAAEPVSPIVRVHERKKIYYGLDICDELLTPKSSEALELIWSRFAPGSSSGAQPYTHDGEEAGVVLSGTLELVIGDTAYTLSAGDSFGFRSSTPHRYRNDGDTDAIVLWAITPPTY
ncbi:MAG: Cro/Cl family transcriptional regulator [Hyphomicrobiales bacterium]|nr:MAG: Cro/Cl family transcriptional regulator [Hyphomicrobiales bacterium]